VGRKKPRAGVRSGENRVTLTRIARELGISAMTVSNAYNHPDRLSEALRERIFETARRLGYQGPDPVGRSLRRQRTDVVGVLYSKILPRSLSWAVLARSQKKQIWACCWCQQQGAERPESAPLGRRHGPRWTGS
jgi:hypothetical protein